MPPPPVQGYRLCTLVVLVSWLILSSPWLSGAVTIPYDAKALFQAQIQFLANAFHSGQSPFWSPNVFVGMPSIADPQSLIFTPAVVLAYFEKVPIFRDVDAYVLVMLGIGALAIIKLFQDRGWHPAGAAIAAIAYAFGASAAWRIQHIAQIESYGLFAPSLWLLARALDRSSPLYGALAGLGAGLMVAAPNQVAMLACYVLAGFVLAHWAMSEDRRLALRRSVWPLGCAAVVGAAVVAVPLLMTYLFLATSNRPAMDLSEAVHGSLHPASLLTTVVADLYGALDPDVDYWGPYSEYWDKNEITLSQNMGQMYVGALPILLILTAGVTRGLLWAREIRLYVIAIAVLGLYAFGTYTPAFALMYKVVPGVSFFRRPVDATFLIGAMMAIVGGYLVHRWATLSTPFASERRRALEIGLIAVVFVMALATAAVTGKLSLAGKPALLALGWLAFSALLLAAPVGWLKRGGAPLVVIPAALLTADLAFNNGPNESTALPAEQYEILKPNSRNETIRFLKERLRRAPGTPWRDRVELVGLGFEWPNVTLVHGFEHTLGYNPFRLGIVSEAIGARDYIAGPDQRVFAPLFPSYRSTLANLLGLRFILSSVPIEQVDTRLPKDGLEFVTRTSDAYIYENIEALPRVMFVAEWKRADFRRLLRDGQWPDFDPTRTVLLQAPPPASKAKSEAGSRPSRPAEVRIKAYENTRVAIEVDAAEDGFVLLNDVWHPWWVAKVDGAPVEILQANVMFRAVAVTAGQHIVEFEFAPLSGAVAELGRKLQGRPEQDPARAKP
jgi:hypothetical protein